MSVNSSHQNIWGIVESLDIVFVASLMVKSLTSGIQSTWIQVLLPGHVT